MCKGSLKEAPNGSICVFLALCLTLIMSLILIMYEGARSAAARAYAGMLLSAAAESALAEYYRPLFDKYHIFALDTGFGSRTGGSEKLKAGISKYFGENVWDYEVVDCRVDKTVGLLEDDARCFAEQVSEYQPYGNLETIVERLLDNLEIFKGTDKAAGFMEKKLELEGKLAEIDTYTLELMCIIDGVECSGLMSGESGIGRAENFVKEFFILPVSPSTTGINHPEIYELMKPGYKNPVTYINRMLAAGKGYVQKRELMEDLNKQIQMLNSSLANANSKAAEGTGKVLATIMMLYGRALMEAEAFRAECMKCSLELRELCETTVERLAAAAKKLDSIITLQNTLRPLVEGYESLIGTAGAILSDDIVQSLNESVELMKSYVGLDSGVSGRYDFAAMAEVIRQNAALMTRINIKELTTMPVDSVEATEAWLGIVSDKVGELEKFCYDGLVFDYGEFKMSSLEDEVSKGFKRILSDGYLGLLVPDTDALSESKLDSMLLPSMWMELMSDDESDAADRLAGKLDRDNGDELLGEADKESSLSDISSEDYDFGEIKDKLLMALYIQENFKNYRKQNDGIPTVLKYEQEYILCGNSEDRVNLSSVLVKIMLLRLVMTAVYTFSDRDMTAKAGAFASSVMGFTGMPFLISAVKYLILFIWAFEQAIVETAAIAAGKRVPAVTNRKCFCIEFEELLLFSGDFVQKKVEKFYEAEYSPDYCDYLLMFFLIQNEREQRGYALDLIQENLRDNYDDNLLLYNCICSFEVSADYSYPSGFLSYPLLLLKDYFDIDGYLVTISDSCAY